MRLKFLKGVIATVAVALFVGYGVSRSVNNSSTEFDELTLANVEALADGEGDFYIGIGVTIPIFKPNCVCKHGGCFLGHNLSLRKRCLPAREYTGQTDCNDSRHKCNKE
ncbi:NVEALA domain-containing protein [Capnocytophaga cynodegmi]|uniref:Uncharacterized protein n=1 Tax=Capnocytophaga cynodegmi TaxID=28189 RepID=A0A0B7HDS2_9FLAO|nr:NVEALA domain-containing protein [Capnocytophaga cynodegmi]CEN36774.1 exported hypothetical protein [Capnocytophaga cynodegmi]